VFPIERTLLRQGVISIEITFVRGLPPALLHIKHYVRESSAAMFSIERTLRQQQPIPHRENLRRSSAAVFPIERTIRQGVISIEITFARGHQH
jgi:hypothetical protein